MDYSQLDKLVNQISPGVVQELIKILQSSFDKCGLYYRIFGRTKSPASLINKLSKKAYDDSKRLQDLFGIRVVLYFKDDIEICRKIIENILKVDNISQDIEKIDTFSPTRLNYVCVLPSKNQSDIPEDLTKSFPIDNTFEVQIRTIFSEGWHEIEHDLRYKSNSDWEGNNDLSRVLNGIFATLETCDWSILNVFDELSYRKYKNKDWEAMLKNKLRIRFQDDKIDERIIELLADDPNLSKELLRVDRHELLVILSDKRLINFPKTLNNVIYTINELYCKNPIIRDFTPVKLREHLDRIKAT